MLYLRTFGALELENGHTRPTGAALHLSRLAVLAVVASSGDLGVSRDSLYALFWPESTVKRARGSLKQALFALRRDLGCEQLTIGRTVLHLNPSVITADVVHFVNSQRSGDCRTAVKLYRGEFLSGIRIRGSTEFDDWVEKQRAILGAHYRKCLENLATTGSRQGDPDETLEWWKQLADADPYGSTTTLGYMHALNSLGRREEAIRYGALHVQRVRSDLDAAPEHEVIEAISKLKVCSGLCQPETPPKAAARSVPAKETIDKSAVEGRTRRFSKRILTPLVSVSSVAAIFALLAGAPPSRERPTGDGIRIETFSVTPTNDSLQKRVSSLTHALDLGLKRYGFAPAATGVTVKPDPPRQNVTTVIGSVSTEGDSIVLRAAIKDGRTGSIIGAIKPVRVSPEKLAKGWTLLADELLIALGKPYQSVIFPLLSTPTPPSSDSAYFLYIRGVGEATTPSAPLVFSSDRFRQAYQADTLFPTALLAEALSYRNKDSLSHATRLLAYLNHQRKYLSPLNRLTLSYLSYEANGDFDAKREVARRASDLAPQSAWSLEAAELAIDGGQPEEAEGYLGRYELGVTRLTQPGMVTRFQNLSLEAAHRRNDPAHEWRVIMRANDENDTSIVVQFALARRLILDHRFDEASLVVKQMLHSHGLVGYSAVLRLREEMNCHQDDARSALISVFGFRDSIPDDVGRARIEASDALSRGAWWYASRRLRAVLDSFPSHPTAADSARSAYVEANMIDTNFADTLIHAMSKRRSFPGDGSAEYWLAAALVKRGRIVDALPLLAVARKKGLPVLRSGHADSPELELLRRNHLVGKLPECSPNQ